MPSLVLNDVLQVTLGYIVQGQQCLLTRHYFLKNIPSDPDYDTWLSEVITSWLTGGTPISTKMAAMQHPDVYQNFIMVQKVYPQRWYYLRIPQNIPGTFADAAALPSNSAVTITLQPETPGRGRSGSAHIGGLTMEAPTPSGRVSEAYQTLMTDLAEELQRGIGGVAPNHYLEPCMYRPVGTNRINPVISFAIQDSMRVMRRRTLGLGI